MDISLEIFLQTAIFQSILEDPNVLAIFLSGSRSIGLETENSDYDLICLVREKEPHKRVPGFEVASKVFHVQCFYRDVENMLENYAGGVWLESLIPEHVLYLNPEARELWSRFIEKKGEIAQLSNARYHGVHSK
jgi:predicted nucleotidyltransferase